MRYYELTESNAIEDYMDMAKENGLGGMHGGDPADNMAVIRLMNLAINIRADCQPFLSQISPGKDYNIAWRGLKNEKSYQTQSVIKDVRLDKRNPLTTEDDLHDYVNKQFTELYGAPFRNAMFMTGSEPDVLRYGDPFQVFPIGEFRFLWSNTVRDLWLESRFIRRALSIPKERLGDDEEGRKNKLFLQSEFDDFYDKVLSTYTLKDLYAALYSGKEIMVRCEQYYAVSFDNITNNVLDSNKTYPYAYEEQMRESVETVFYNIVNDK